MFACVQDGKLYASLNVAFKFDEGARVMASTSGASQFFIPTERGRHDAIEVCNANVVAFDEVDSEAQVCSQSNLMTMIPPECGVAGLMATALCPLTKGQAREDIIHILISARKAT